MSQEENEIMINTNNQIVYVYRKYESQKKAVKKYQEAHKEEIHEYSRQYHRNRYLNDESYREEKKKKALQRYYLKKNKEEIGKTSIYSSIQV
jgi:uncharacterized protein (DUF924 family)